ncbi:MAG: iron-sulfur cluster assembly protein [Solirubrobacterales bacterium]|nr:iron-sulfur cluster assembly protein [Solirubrobacterales bacterium]MBV9363942.1 iron-sulfur cluster assembly protein [Solirubrobacterales bacterium]MBV9714436.1 iron-sulfur cluster assembly protein [Solirubrobacterales bacterium]MBV9807673.1 iron-sulfur cluster assembly protein [Solirubrobacterales bacterium]
MTATAPMAASVMDALAEVYDPELDEPITRLGFVTSCEVGPTGDVAVVLRLPTPQCAPNFAFLMAADARRVVRRLPEVREVTITLEDHYTGEEINAAIGRGEGFAGAFPGETADDDLRALRELFKRKALVARQSRLCEALLAAGATPEEVTACRVGDLRDRPDARRCLKLRAELGIQCEEDSPAFVLPSGEPVAAEDLRRWLRTARLVRMSLEVNGGICRSLLRVHRGVEIDDPEEVLT